MEVPSSSPPSVPASSSEVHLSPHPEDHPPSLSKSQMKKRRRHERSQAVKIRRKEQTREARRLRAALDGRDLEAERRRQVENEADGSGRARRDARWEEILARANVGGSFRVCFDCSFEDRLTDKERNSLALQLRYAYAVNRRSSAPVLVDVCGLRGGGTTRLHLENVEGFPDRWEERAYRCHEGDVEEVYAHCRGMDGDGDGDGEASAAAAAADDDAVTRDVDACDGGPGARPRDEDATTDAVGRSPDDASVADNGGARGGTPARTSQTTRRRLPTSSSSSSLPPDHRFVYLTGDSPNALTTLDDNTTYIIGGIVDRNRLKFAAMERAESINARMPHLDVGTARLPLEEHVDLKGSTRILTCNHVFEILQRYRENGYADWRKAIMAVLPCRKDVEEKKTDDDGKGEGEANEEKEDGGVDLDAKVDDVES